LVQDRADLLDALHNSPSQPSVSNPFSTIPMSRMLLGGSKAVPPAVEDLCNMTQGLWAPEGVPRFNPSFECEACSSTTYRNNESVLKFISSAPAQVGNTRMPSVESTYPKKAHSDGIESLRSIPEHVLAVWRHMENNRDGNCLRAGTMKYFFVAFNTGNNNRSSNRLNLKAALKVTEITAPSKFEAKLSAQNVRNVSNNVCFDVEAIHSTSSTVDEVQGEDGWSSDTSL